jgi:small subunit ribosomal protein S13
MIQILGIFLKENKKFYLQVQRVFGIGSTRAAFLCRILGISQAVKVNKLAPGQIRFIRKFLETHYLLGRDLKKNIHENIERLSSIGAYRGTRHRYGLPVRGQRTRTNARTRKKYKRKDDYLFKIHSKKNKTTKKIKKK